MEFPPLKIMRTHPDALMPTKSHEDDAGFDLYTCTTVIINPGKWEDVPIGIAIEPPYGIWMRIVGRSSTFRKRKLSIIEGIIDEGYRGELFVGCWNIGDEPVEILPGERLCQMLPQRTESWMEAMWAEDLAESPRGQSGFGSTGS